MKIYHYIYGKLYNKIGNYDKNIVIKHKKTIQYFTFS